MAVTLRELFAAAHYRIDRPSADPRGAAQDAVAVFDHVARGLDHLYGSGPTAQSTPEMRPDPIANLIVAARDAARCWPQAHGPVTDLVGAAVDAVVTRSHLFDDPQRWALSVELAETTRRAADTARRFAPYANVPHLIAARDAAVACEQRAAQNPDATDPTALDRIIPGTARAGGLPAIVDAAAALHEAAVTRPHTRWRMAEVVIAINAAQVAAAHAASYVAHLPAEPGTHPWHRPSLSAPEAWSTARILCRPFDDATKLRPPVGSAIVGSAARLGRGVIDQLGPAPTVGVLSAEQASDDPERAGAILTVIAVLPEIANQLQRAVHAFAYTGQLWAPERNLLAHEERDEIGVEPPRLGVPQYRDLERLITTLPVAGTLSTALAADLASVAPTRLPDVTRAHTASTAANGALSAMAMGAHDAARRGRLIVEREWAMTPTSNPRRTNPR